MKYFTPALFARQQNFDTAAMDAADADWEAAEERYEQRLQNLAPLIDPVLKRFEGILLHDATVWGISRREDQFVIVLHKDIPPRDVVTLTYTLAGEPLLDHDALPPQFRSRGMQFEYDEFDVGQESGQPHFTHSILFSNGWEIRLPFREVQVMLAQPIYPLPPGQSPGKARSA
ncbi:MAG TPA: hypothetical protein VKA46_10635 [Gemmataceae bacterium]|nr:hypothetical protein [Gemmataceae bacterium]